MGKIEAFDVSVCSRTGDPGCLDCCEGLCNGLQDNVTAEFHRCTECGADDVYAPLIHAEACSLHSSTPPSPRA